MVGISILVLSLTVAFAQEQRVLISPGSRLANKAQEQNDRSIPPPMEQRSSRNPEKLKADAEELSQLAQSIPSQVDLTTKGVLPKDLAEKLKRIEKLAKQLRGEISR
jgi:hypothetical protein